MAASADPLFNSDSHSLVLCIDDDPDILELTKWTLEKKRVYRYDHAGVALRFGHYQTNSN